MGVLVAFKDPFCKPTPTTTQTAHRCHLPFGWKTRWNIDCDLSQIQIGRNLVETAFQDSVPDDLLMDMVSIAGELVENSLKMGEIGRSAVVVLSYDYDQAAIMVRDQNGRRGHWAPLLHQIGMPDVFAEHGRGLPIIKRLTEANRGRLEINHLRGGVNRVIVTLPVPDRVRFCPVCIHPEQPVLRQVVGF